MLKDNNITLNANQYLLNSLAKACKVVNDKVRHRFPIQKGLLSIILKQIDTDFHNQFYLKMMYKVLFSTAFGLFRVGELKGTFSGHAVLAKDVHIGQNKQKILFMLHSSKTHHKGAKPQKIKILLKPIGSKRKHEKCSFAFCPYQLLRNYLRVCGGYISANEQFFIFGDSAPVLADHMCNTLKKVMSNAGYNSKLYDTQLFKSWKEP